MGPGFSGEVATYYATFRRGYPAAAVDAMVEAFALTGDDLVVDLGCGTGQLSLPLAARVRAVVGLDPEPDMLVLARQAALQSGVTNTSWVLGADSDLPALGALLGHDTLRDWDALRRTVKPIYTAVNATAARAAFEQLAETWGQRYPAIVKPWNNAWEEFIPFLDYVQPGDPASVVQRRRD